MIHSQRLRQIQICKRQSRLNWKKQHSFENTNERVRIRKKINKNKAPKRKKKKNISRRFKQELFHAPDKRCRDVSDKKVFHVFSDKPKFF